MEETLRPSRMRRIFNEMENSEVNLQCFYEQLEKEFGNYCPFSKFKSLLESFYPHIDKTDIIHFLSKVHLNSSGNINLTLLFNAIAKYLNKEILSLKLVFYNIAYILSKKMKISTKEFFYKLGYQMQTELNPNDFITKVIPEFKLSEHVGIIIFKSIDIKNKGVILVQDFVTVIDSYRNDSSLKKGDNMNTYDINGINYGRHKISDKDFYWLNKLANKILYENSTITPKMLFDISKIENEDVMSLDILKKKLFNIVFNKQIKAEDLNLMIKALDVNKNNKLSFEEFNDLLLLPKKYGNLTQTNIINTDNITTQDNQGILSELPLKRNYSTFDKFKFEREVPLSGNNKLPTLNDIIDINRGNFDINNIPKERTISGINSEMNTNINNRDQIPQSPYPQPIMGYEKNSQGNLPSINALLTNQLSKEIIYNDNNNNKENIPINNNIVTENSNIDNNIDNSIEKVKSNKDNNLITNANLSINLGKYDNNFNDIEKKPTLTFLKGIENQDPNLAEFIKELSVFECGEWSLIDLLEDFYPQVEKEFFPIQNLFISLKEKFNPTISLSKIKTCVDNIDKDKDGYFSYLDLINFLNNNFNYGSTKLGWKLIAAKILSTFNTTPSNYFNKKFHKSKKHGNEITFINFTKLLIDDFSLDPPLAKQMYDDLQKLIFNHKITKGDIIDAVNRQIELNKEMQKEKKDFYKDINELKLLNYNKENIIKNENTGITLLDQKYFEEQMKKLVALLQKAFLIPGKENPKKLFTDNLSAFLHLPNDMNLSQFRKLFINQLQIDLSLGIGIFQLAKSYNKNKEKNLPTISKDDLLNILTSYMNFDIKDFEPKLFLYYLESANYTSLKYCFEALDYNKNGITVIELQRHLEMFYPNVPANIIKLIPKDIDEEFRGIVSFKDLNNYLNKVCTREENKFSENLIFKHCASILDSQNISTEKYFKKNLGIKKSIKIKEEELIVEENEHNKYFSEVLELNYVDCRKLWTFLAINTSNNYYYLMRLVRLVNFFRIEKN
jgi:hypothetical protein